MTMSDEKTGYPRSAYSPNVTDPQAPQVGGDWVLWKRETEKHPVLQSREVVEQAAIKARCYREKRAAKELELAKAIEAHKTHKADLARAIANFEEDAERQDAISTGYYANANVEVEIRINYTTNEAVEVRADTNRELVRRTVRPGEVQMVLAATEEPASPEPDDVADMDTVLLFLNDHAYGSATPAQIAKALDLDREAVNRALEMARAQQLDGEPDPYVTGPKAKRQHITEPGAQYATSLTADE